MLLLAGSVFVAKDCTEKIVFKENDRILHQKIKDTQIQNEILINQVLDLQNELLEIRDQIDELKSERQSNDPENSAEEKSSHN